MTDWDKELPTFKAARNGEVELRPTGRGKKQPRKWKVISFFLNNEYIVHRAATEDACKAWIEKKKRTYYIGRRNAPAEMHDKAKLRAESRAERYRIEPPKTDNISPGKSDTLQT